MRTRGRKAVETPAAASDGQAPDLPARLAAAEARVRELEAALAARPGAEIVPLGSEDLFDRVIDRLPGNLVRRVLYPDGRIVYPYVSRGLYDTFGIRPEDIMGQADANFDWIHPDDRAAWQAALERSAERLEPLDHENRVVAPDGRVSWVRSIAKPRRGAAGEIIWDGIALDVTDRKQAEAAMRQARDEAEQANQSKSKFLAAASHDLRQPLQSLRFLLAALTRERQSRKARQQIESMDHCLDSLEGLLDALLDISKLDAGVVRPRPTVLPIGPLLEGLVRELAPQAAEKGLALRLVPSRQAVRSDPLLLQTVLRNLLSNAIKYTDEGRVLIGCRRRGAVLRIEVADSGIGIDPEQQRAIFEPFHQVANVARDRSLGLGLGLAIVERVAALLGHPIGLRSEAGVGSTFWIELPREAAPAPRPAGEALAEPLAEPASLRGLDVLLIEDDRDVADSLRILLADWGCDLRVAANAETAVALCAERPAKPSLIIADYRLPGPADGKQAVDQVLAAIGERRPVIFLTGDTEPARIREAKASGHRLLHKPVRPAKLRALMSHLLAEHQRSSRA